MPTVDAAVPNATHLAGNVSASTQATTLASGGVSVVQAATDVDTTSTARTVVVPRRPLMPFAAKETRNNVAHDQDAPSPSGPY